MIIVRPIATILWSSPRYLLPRNILHQFSGLLYTFKTPAMALVSTIAQQQRRDIFSRRKNACKASTRKTAKELHHLIRIESGLANVSTATFHSVPSSSFCPPVVEEPCLDATCLFPPRAHRSKVTGSTHESSSRFFVPTRRCIEDSDFLNKYPCRRCQRFRFPVQLKEVQNFPQRQTILSTHPPSSEQKLFFGEKGNVNIREVPFAIDVIQPECPKPQIDFLLFCNLLMVATDDSVDLLRVRLAGFTPRCRRRRSEFEAECPSDSESTVER